MQGPNKDKVCFNSQAYGNAGGGVCGSFCKIKADFPEYCANSTGATPMCNAGPLLSDYKYAGKKGTAVELQALC